MAKSNAAHRSLIYAAKVLAGTAIDLINDTDIIEKAKSEVGKVRGKKSITPVVV